jgi:hypothetical protein
MFDRYVAREDRVFGDVGLEFGDAALSDEMKPG